MFYAERIQDAVSGVGTDEQQLIRVIVGRSEVILCTHLRHILINYLGNFGKEKLFNIWNTVCT